ncbi:TP53-binding protein 1 isoform X3 [Erpetoichthys calabaricus]|uniref:TP53-binding protein 1 isoform X3 n=1 Tax=Erpetoichthys calabaricus TaxID=27687 RepID=UPI00223417C2|nr:TP53-binding protein 1 isoform X3 [Erpetoichthys calabaricus]
MDPGSSELDPGLSQQEAPCLIVEDSQPESVAMEDDPDRGYHTLLAKRLSSLQSSTRSPELELICAQQSSKSNKEKNEEHCAVSARSNSQNQLPEELEQHSQVFEVFSLQKMKSKQSEEVDDKMQDGADSITHVVQLEESSQLVSGFLELSESQNVEEALESTKTGDEEQCNAEKGHVSPKEELFQRSEAESGCTTNPQLEAICMDNKKTTVHDLLLGERSQAEGPSDLENSSKVPSTQEDMFECENKATVVDTTVSAIQSQFAHMSTPAANLCLLHLSGQTPLAQESLSQNSSEFVASSQDNFGPTPVIIPSSPTEGEDAQGDEPMDTSVPPEDFSQAGKSEEEPMETDFPPGETDSDFHARPKISTPTSHSVPAFNPKTALPVPSQPEFSNDIFIPTQSLETRNSNTSEQVDKTPNLIVSQEELTSVQLKEDDKTQKDQKEYVTNQQECSMPGEVFCLELSVNTETTATLDNKEASVKKTEESDDSELTQIEDLRKSQVNSSSGTFVTQDNDLPSFPSKIEPQMEGLPKASELEPSQGKTVLKTLEHSSSNIQKTKVKCGSLGTTEIFTSGAASVTPVNILPKESAADTTYSKTLLKPSELVDVPTDVKSHKLEMTELTVSSSLSDTVPTETHVMKTRVCFSHFPKSLPVSNADDITNFQPSSCLNTFHEDMEIHTEDIEACSETVPKEITPRDVKPVELGPKNVEMREEVQDVVQETPEDEQENMEEGEVGLSSSLCLALSQSQAFSPSMETVDEEHKMDSDSLKGQGAHDDSITLMSAKERNSKMYCFEEGVQRESIHGGENMLSHSILVNESDPVQNNERETVSQGKEVSSEVVALVSSEESVVIPKVKDMDGGVEDAVENMISGITQEAKIKSNAFAQNLEVQGSGPEKIELRMSMETASHQSDKNIGNSVTKTLSDSSGDIPFHFTLPKEGEMVHHVAVATPPLLGPLKLAPRHSTPIELGSCSETGNLCEDGALPTSDIAAEEIRVVAESNEGKLSLQMKMVMPSSEETPESAQFSLQKPISSEEEIPVSTAENISKAIPRSSSGSISALHSRESISDGPRTQRLKHISRSHAVMSSDLDIADESCEMPLREDVELQSGSATYHSKEMGCLTKLNYKELESQTEMLVQRPVTEASTQTEGHLKACVEELEPRENILKSCSMGVQTESTNQICQRAISQQTSFDASIPLNESGKQKEVSQQMSFDDNSKQESINKDEVTPPFLSIPGHSVSRHVRTTREIRTTVTRIITDVYYENGKEINRTVIEESDEPVVDCRVSESDMSSSRSRCSMTSGDLGDVSSLSSKASSLQRSSSATSSTGAAPVKAVPSETAGEFAIPTGRQGPFKSASPQKSCVQLHGSLGWPESPEGTVSGREDRDRASRRPLSSQGRGKRGRPSSYTSSCSRNDVIMAQKDKTPSSVSSSSEESITAFTHVCSQPDSNKSHLVCEASPRGALRRSNSPEIALLSPQSTDTSSNSFVGLRVVAKWSSNGYFYSGCIIRDVGDGRFRLLFDDGYECDVLGKDILLCDPIPLETEVTALSDDEYFSSGVVKGHKKQGTDFFYCVEKDGQRKWYRRMAVILSLEQGNRLREQYGLGPYEPTTPFTKASDISLDNLVEGKRKRRGNLINNSTPSRTPTESPRGSACSSKRKLMCSEDDQSPAKRGRKSSFPKKAWQHGEMCSTSESGCDLPSNSSDLVETFGPLPQSTSLFLGYAFLLTTSSENDRETNHTGDNKEEEYVETAPYNKQYTERQLRAGGGYVMLDVSDSQCNSSYERLLIADQHCRTQKYLLSVANGIPCVSHIWVRDCCRANQTLSFRNYMLPAGLGLLENRIIEWHPRRSPFESLQVLLISEKHLELWADLLMMGGASSVRQHSATSQNKDIAVGVYNLLVTDTSCSDSVLKCAAALDIPVVSPEWVIQSIIVGERQDYDAHPKYKHNYSPM